MSEHRGYSVYIQNNEIEIKPWTFPRIGDYTVLLKSSDEPEDIRITVREYLEKRVRLASTSFPSDLEPLYRPFEFKMAFENMKINQYEFSEALKDFGNFHIEPVYDEMQFILKAVKPTNGPKQHSIDDLAQKRKQMHSKQYRNQRRP